MIFNKTINCYYKKYWYCFFFGILFLILVDVTQLFLPKIIGDLVDAISDKTLTSEIIAKNVLYIFLIGIAVFVGRIVWRLFINGVNYKIQSDLRKRLFIHCENLPKEFYTTHKTGGLMALLTNDVESVGETFSAGVMFLIDVVCLGSMAFIYMAQMNWALALVSAVPLVFLIFSGNILEKYETKTYEENQQAFENLSDFTTESFSGISVIKAFIKEKEQLSNFAKHADNNRKKSIAFIKLDSLYTAIINAIIYISAVLIIVVGGIFIINDVKIPGTTTMTGGNLSTFYGYFDTLVWPILAIVFLISTASRGKASCNRITELLNTKITVKDKEGLKDDNEVKGAISIRNLTFSYPDGSSPALKNINVDIKPGENIGIIGRTGSGKTTFVNTILKLYNVEDGHVFIDGKDINLWTTHKLREAIGYVAQDTFLFSCSISDNIAFSNPCLNKEKIEMAARFACVADNIKDFKEGYNTVIGERGVTLSGGQKQRISMARAIAKDPQILILDDSVSAVDSSTEKEILSNIKRLRKGKTTLIVAHRISAVEDLDHIIVLDEGSIVGFGTHFELLADNKVYQDIVKLQELEKEVK